MSTINLTDARAQLSKLVDRVVAGESVHITRHGRTVAQLTAITGSRKRIDAALLQSLTEPLPAQRQDTGNMMRAMRESDRF